LAASAAICLLASVARAGDQGDPDRSCAGNSFEMVECLKAKTAQWDKWISDKSPGSPPGALLTRVGEIVDCVDCRMPAYAAYDEGLFDADPNLQHLRYLVSRCS
jgi:hypothetical protein